MEFGRGRSPSSNDAGEGARGDPVGSWKFGERRAAGIVDSTHLASTRIHRMDVSPFCLMSVMPGLQSHQFAGANAEIPNSGAAS